MFTGICKISLHTAFHKTHSTSTVRTQEHVALQPALLRHGADGDQLGTQSPAGLLGTAPRLLVPERFVAELPKLVPVGPRTSQLCVEGKEIRNMGEILHWDAEVLYYSSSRMQ